MYTGWILTFLNFEATQGSRGFQFGLHLVNIKLWNEEGEFSPECVKSKGKVRPASVRAITQVGSSEDD